mgnify:CR=1 FL=1
MSVAETCPFEVIKTGGVIRLRLLDPAAIRRCSIKELFRYLRRYQPTTADWVDEAGVLTVEFPDEALFSAFYGITTVVSAVFTSHTRSDTWKRF